MLIYVSYTLYCVVMLNARRTPRQTAGHVKNVVAWKKMCDEAAAARMYVYTARPLHLGSMQFDTLLSYLMRTTY